MWAFVAVVTPRAGPGGSSSGGGAGQPARARTASKARRRITGLPDHVPLGVGGVLSRGLGGRTIGLAVLTFARRGRFSTLAPQLDAAGQPVGVRDDRDIRGQRKGDVLGVAAAEIEMVETDDLTENLDYLGDPLVPGFLPLLLAGGVADVFVVGLVPAHRVMGELEMEHDLAIAKERGAGAGAERQYHFHPT